VIDSSPSERAFDRLAAHLDQRAQLRRGIRRFYLEIADLRHFPRQPRHEGRRQRDARQRRILHHDRQWRGVGDPGEVLDHALLVGAQRCAVVGRHEHDHFRAGHVRRLCARRRDARAVVAAGHDYGHPVGDVVQAQCEQRVALFVCQQELL